MATYQASFRVGPFSWTPKVNGGMLSFEADTIEDAAKLAKAWLASPEGQIGRRGEPSLIHLTCFELLQGGSFHADTLERYTP